MNRPVGRRGWRSLRPRALARPTWSLFAVWLSLLAVARTTGAGWVVVVLVGVAAVVAAAAVLPAPGLAQSRIAVVAPRDATAMRPASLSVEVSGPRSPMKARALDPPGPWMRVEPPAAGAMPVVPSRRGVVERVLVEVRSAAPLGLFWWRRRIEVVLERAMDVGPRPVDVSLPLPLGGGTAGSQEGWATAPAADMVRSTREYVPGDPIRLVHWPATARTGAVVVKDLEAPADRVLVIAVDLRGPDEEAVEAAASRAAGLAGAALRSGVPVVLLTAEADGGRVGPVATATEVGRRLARAVVGAPPEGPVPAGATIVRVAASA
ncbi:MAG: DUF58 domain-containing protein, partial [Actinomycetota bacterium]|nr:DUF58 domain-containing protein [Actinomycetota bacterium]